MHFDSDALTQFMESLTGEDIARFEAYRPEGSHALSKKISLSGVASRIGEVPAACERGNGDVLTGGVCLLCLRINTTMDRAFCEYPPCPCAFKGRDTVALFTKTVLDLLEKKKEAAQPALPYPSQQQCLTARNFQEGFLEEWLQVANHFGYETVSDFIYCEYEELGKSLNAIARMTGFDNNSVKYKAKHLGCSIHSRGGANHMVNKTGMFTLQCDDSRFRRFIANIVNVHDQLFMDIMCKGCRAVVSEGARLDLLGVRQVCRPHVCDKFCGFKKELKKGDSI